MAKAIGLWFVKDDANTKLSRGAWWDEVVIWKKCMWHMAETSLPCGYGAVAWQSK